MEVFNLVIDEKATIWERNYVTIEAESLKDAIAKIRAGEYEIDECETLYDSMEYMSPTESEPTTVEVFKEDDLDNPIFTNCINVK